MTIGNSSVASNTAGGAGGGIDNLGATLSLNTVTVSQNTATGIGGGIFNGGGMTISIVTFAGNSGSSGGGLYNSASGSGTVTNATFNLNKAADRLRRRRLQRRPSQLHQRHDRAEQRGLGRRRL